MKKKIKKIKFNLNVLRTGFIRVKNNVLCLKLYSFISCLIKTCIDSAIQQLINFLLYTASSKLSVEMNSSTAVEKVRQLYNVEPCPYVLESSQYKTPIEQLDDYDSIAAVNNDSERNIERQLHKNLQGVRGWPNFSEAFFASSLLGTGVAPLKVFN